MNNNLRMNQDIKVVKVKIINSRFSSDSFLLQKTIFWNNVQSYFIDYYHNEQKRT